MLASQAYEPIIPRSTYSPWLADQEFIRTYEAIHEYTLLDKYRCYELWQLVEQSAKLPKGAILEVGAWRGGSGALIAQKAKLCGIEESVYLCDTFAGVVKAGEKDLTYNGGEHNDASAEKVRDLLLQLELDQAKVLRGIFPEETDSAIEEAEFRLCHIDVDVYQSAKDVLDWVWPRLLLGGMVIFDDYGFEGCNGVTQLVNEQCLFPDRVFIHNLNGHAVFVKVAEI